MPLLGSDTRVDFAPTSTDISILFFQFFFAKKFLRGRFLFFSKFHGRSVGARGRQKRGHNHGWLRDRMKD
jgi:hypothetical protein